VSVVAAGSCVAAWMVEVAAAAAAAGLHPEVEGDGQTQLVCSVAVVAQVMGLVGLRVVQLVQREGRWERVASHHVLWVEAPFWRPVWRLEQVQAAWGVGSLTVVVVVACLPALVVPSVVAALVVVPVCGCFGCCELELEVVVQSMPCCLACSRRVLSP
jgi:hypothetical protein